MEQNKQQKTNQQKSEKKPKSKTLKTLDESLKRILKVQKNNDPATNI